MGIYVPFLKKMPSRCEGCPIIDGTGCRARNPYYMDETGITRPKNCPLVELPPHGNLIDRDALLNKLQALYDERENEARYTGSKEIKISWNDAVYQIIDAPTIIPAEEGE